MNMLELTFKTLIACAAMLFVASCSGDDETIDIAPTEPQEITFESAQGTYDGVTLPYRRAEINVEADSPAALVIYLHGGSSKGSDNEAQIAEPGVDSIKNYLRDSGKNAIFLVPQCPADKSWGATMNAALKALIDEQVASGKVDASRIYILGGSMGGSGTWSLLSAYPGLFAAAMPVAGNPAGCIAENVAQTPLFTVMGTDDRIMSIDPVRNFVAQLKYLGDECTMEVESGWTHEITCIQSYTAKRLEWVFSHTKTK